MDDRYTYQVFSECCEELRSLYAQELNLVYERHTDFLNATALAIIEKYKDYHETKLLPFISSQKYNDYIKVILTKCGITRLVTVLDPITRREEKHPINEIGSSHMARRTFIANIYNKVPDPNVIGSMTGHVEGSRAFARYRTIEEDLKKSLVDILG